MVGGVAGTEPGRRMRKMGGEHAISRGAEMMQKLVEQLLGADVRIAGF
jgi:hypothetical protein